MTTFSGAARVQVNRKQFGRRKDELPRLVDQETAEVDRKEFLKSIAVAVE